jgi:hypothetical protein
MPLLDRLLETRVRVIDYERITNARGNRLVYFGLYAGWGGFGIFFVFLLLFSMRSQPIICTQSSDVPTDPLTIASETIHCTGRSEIAMLCFLVLFSVSGVLSLPLVMWLL